MMNLTRMRARQWSDIVSTIYQQYKDKLWLHDQDIFNTIFHDNPS